MVHAIPAQYPFTGSEGLALYHPVSVEMYFPVAPGIEVSLEPGDVLNRAGDSEAIVYNRKGWISTSPKRGNWIDSYL